MADLWYAIRSRTGKEIEARDEIEAIGITAWCPTYRTLTKPTKKRKPIEVSRPLLPGYILALVPEGQWHDVKACKGVLGWIAGPEGPMPCRRSTEIDLMRERERLGVYDHCGLEGRLQAGDPLEVLFGPFTGWQVTFRGVVGDKIDGEVEMMGAKRRVLINAQHVKLSR